METVIGRQAGRRVLAVVRVIGIGPAAVVGARRDTARHVLVDGHQQPFAADVVISGADGAARADLLLDLDAALARVGALQLPVHRRQTWQRAGRYAAREDRGEDRRRGLCGRQADGDLAQLRYVGRVAGRQQGVGHGAERHAVVEDAGIAANDRAAGSEGRPHHADARRHVVGVGLDGLQPLQVVADAGVQRDARGHLPLVLGVQREVGIGLRDVECAEGLREARVVVDAGQKIRQRREPVAAAEGAGIGDPIVVVDEIDAEPQRMAAALVREVVDDLVERVSSRRGIARARPERRDAGNAHRGTDEVDGRRGEIAGRELRARLEHGTRGQHQRVAEGNRLIEVVDVGGRARRGRSPGIA